METTHRSRELTAQRLETFSDGVFAIAVTLLVLDMRVPHASDAQASGAAFHLSSALLKLWLSHFSDVLLQAPHANPAPRPINNRPWKSVSKPWVRIPHWVSKTVARKCPEKVSF